MYFTQGRKGAGMNGLFRPTSEGVYNADEHFFIQSDLLICHSAQQPQEIIRNSQIWDVMK